MDLFSSSHMLLPASTKSHFLHNNVSDTLQTWLTPVWAEQQLDLDLRNKYYVMTHTIIHNVE